MLDNRGTTVLPARKSHRTVRRVQKVEFSLQWHTRLQDTTSKHTVHRPQKISDVYLKRPSVKSISLISRLRKGFNIGLPSFSAQDSWESPNPVLRSAH